jgi:hypothetical protein
MLLSEPSLTKTKPTSRQSKRQVYKRARYNMWHLAYLDKCVFGQASLKLFQSDLLQVWRQIKLTPRQGAYYAIQRQPNLPLSLTNTILVNKLLRRFLLALWKLTKDDKFYSGCLKGLTLWDEWSVRFRCWLYDGLVHRSLVRGQHTSQALSASFSFLEVLAEPFSFRRLELNIYKWKRGSRYHSSLSSEVV